MPPAGLQPPPGKLGHRQEGPPVGTPQGLYRGERAGRLRERRLHGRGQGEAAGLPGRGCSRPVTGFLGAGDMSRGESDMDTPTSDCGWRRGGGLRARPGPTGAPAGTGSSSRALRTSRRPHFRHFPGNSFHVGRIAHTASVRFDENRGRPRGRHRSPGEERPPAAARRPPAPAGPTSVAVHSAWRSRTSRTWNRAGGVASRTRILRPFRLSRGRWTRCGTTARTRPPGRLPRATRVAFSA